MSTPPELRVGVIGYGVMGKAHCYAYRVAPMLRRLPVTPEVMDNRFFNTLFVTSPQGEVVHKAAKNHLWCRERSCVPHDVYDRWVELFGDGIERRPGLRAPADGAPVRHRRRQLAHRRLPGRRARAHHLGRQHVRGRHHRHRGAAPVPRDEPQLELDEGPADGDLQRMYAEPVHPKNLWLHDDPLRHADVAEIYRANIGRLVARGSFTPPARPFPGARYIAPAESSGDAGWEQVRGLWPAPEEE